MIDLLITKILEISMMSVMHVAYDEVVTHRNALIVATTNSVLFRNRKIRISIAELLRIQHGDDYILMGNRKRRELYSPIGGVVRCFPSGLKLLRENIGFVSEKVRGGSVNRTPGEELDLRGYVKGGDFAAFLRWFYTGKGRERAALTRELVEEFNEIRLPKIAGLVNNVEFDLVRIVHEGPSKVAGTDYWQYRLLLINELVREHEASRIVSDAIIASVAKSPKLISASVGEIRRGRAAEGELIADSAGYLFGKERIRPAEPAPIGDGASVSG